MKVSGHIVTPDGIVDGTIHIDGDRISAIRARPVAGDAPLVVPGFVDMHVHGGGGHTFTTGDVASARAAAAFHLRHGTTTMLASLVSSPYELMDSATRAFAPLVAEGVLAGVHLEGPYLSRACCGAQNPVFLRDPSTSELSALLDATSGVIRMVTIAPELPGAIGVIKLLTERGVVAAIGHTDATYAQTLDAVEAGASVGTHVFNGMRPPHHRAPGPVFALLGASGVVCEFIADGNHLADETLHFATSVVGPGRAALVTDAIAAAGMPDGQYELGGRPVVVSDRVARLVEHGNSPGAIAGSTLTMDAALRRAVHAGLSLVEAARAAATTPADALGLGDDRGSLAVGMRGDLVVLDANLTIVRVMRAGVWNRRPIPSTSSEATA